MPVMQRRAQDTRTGLLRAAREMVQHGTFTTLAGAASFTELNGFFRDDASRRGGPGR